MTMSGANDIPVVADASPTLRALRVSVVIPAFNSSRSIERAIQSAQRQTETNIEIIVVDDASTDNTAEIVEDLSASDPRIQLRRLAKNGGPSVARNTGIACATGRWIALLDADDAIAPHRLVRLCELAEKNHYDAIGDDILYYDTDAAKVVKPGSFITPGKLSSITLTEYLRTTTYHVGWREALFKEDAPLSLLKFVMSRDFLLKQHIVYAPQYRYCEDFVFYFDLLKSGAHVAVLGECNYIYTEPLGSISRVASPHSRTIRDRKAVVRAVEQLLLENPNLSENEKRLLLARKASAEAAIGYDAFRTEIFLRGKARQLLHLVTKPRFWWRYAREMRHGLQSWLRSRGHTKQVL